MLSRILMELEGGSGIVDLNGLSRALGVERSALDGMLRLLVRQGRLREVRCDGVACKNCQSGCCCSWQESRMGKLYELPG